MTEKVAIKDQSAWPIRLKVHSIVGHTVHWGVTRQFVHSREGFAKIQTFVMFFYKSETTMCFFALVPN